MPNDYQFNFVEIPDEGHSFVPYKAFYDGLANIFTDYPMPFEIITDGYESVTEYFTELSQKYGYEIKISEWAYMNLINNLNIKMIIRIHHGQVCSEEGFISLWAIMRKLNSIIGKRSKTRIQNPSRIRKESFHLK